MPQLVVLALLGAGAVAGYRWFSRALNAANDAAVQAEAEMQRAAAQASHQPKDLGKLELDPVNGVYRPKS